MTRGRAALLALALAGACRPASDEGPAPGGRGGDPAAGSGGAAGGASGAAGAAGSAGSASGGSAGAGVGGATGVGGGGAGGAGGDGADPRTGTGGATTSDAAAEAPGPNADATSAEGGPAVTDPGSEGDGDHTINGPYQLPPEATPVPGAPVGKLESFMFASPAVFPGSNREVSVYIPAQYQAGSEAALLVLQDGPAYVRNFRLPVVLDTLIHRKQVPVQVAVFIANAGGNRSLEYDSLNDRYVRFVLDEVLPEVERRYPVKLTRNPQGRAAGGHSSGGIAAFTMGWQRPDQFQRILTHNGSFTNIRGGNVYPGLVRDSAVKPLRVYLFTGSNDLNAGAGVASSWPKANQAMAAALAAKQYHYRFVFANGTSHDQRFAASITPESLVWLWRGYGP